MQAIQIKSSVAKELITDCLRAKLVPMLAGSPGIGKSDIFRSIAEEFGLKLIDHRLSTSDPTDLSGFPAIVEGRATYTPFDLFPVDGTEVPKGFNGWLLFLDEFNSAPMSVQAAAYKLALDRMVGQHHLHENCFVVCAGNLESDGAIVNRLSTAMQSRLIHLELAVDYKEWLSWAYSNDIDHRVTSFINSAPDKLHRFNPDHNDKTFPCPRTWEFMSRIIKPMQGLPFTKMPVMAGTVGQGMAREFLQFCELEKDIPTFAQISENPENTPIPNEPSTTYFLCGTIANKTDDKNISKVIKYVERMPIEFQIVCFRDLLKRKNTLKKNPAIRKWISENSQELFD